MRLKLVLPLIMLVLAVGLSVWKVNSFWQNAKNQVYPERGDWDYYVQACSHIPLDHPVVPVLLHSLNHFVNNPDLTVLSMMTLGYTIVFFSVYHLSRMRGCHPIACVVAFIIIPLSQGYLTPTALKNVWAVAFLLVSLMLLSRLEQNGRDLNPRKLQITTFSAFVVTLLTHTIAVFALFPVLLCYTLKSLRDRTSKHTKFFIISLTVISILIAIGAFTPQLFRLGKLGNLTSDFLSNPLSVTSYNVNRAFSHPENYTHFIIYLTAAIMGIAYFGDTRKFEPLFFGLLLAYSGLFFLGSEPFADRLHSTGITFLGVLCAYVLTMFQRKDKELF